MPQPDPNSFESVFPNALQGLALRGIKSVRDEVSLQVKPLTILCGANSSGKSSTLQALLLLKQTADASFDAGQLYLGGDCVRFTSTEQLLWFNGVSAQGFEIGLKLGAEWTRLVYETDGEAFRLDAVARGPHRWRAGGTGRFMLDRLDLTLDELGEPVELLRTSVFADWLHVPGLRGLPERAYPRTSAGPRFPGRFSPYTASVIAHWQVNKPAFIAQLAAWLKQLGLTDQIAATSAGSSAIELHVAQRMGHGARVSVADVGIGVSQVLPVLVAILAARFEQLVLIEQPELHLHPRAQAALADILAEAAHRYGRRMIVETHSAILLRRLQTLVARDELPADKLALHWFSRDAEGVTRVDTVQLDERGAYGDWPEDFSEVESEVDGAYIDAATAKL
ncbi:MAG: AAA family ATPase [Myxococcales bacterium]|nr:AAA family ATPase [Myxococcales bacterium]